jgi:hypothetical protein
MSDKQKKVFANSVIPNVWYNSYLRFCPKGIDQCLILFLNYIIFIVFTTFIHFRFQPNTFVKTITTRLVICIYILANDMTSFMVRQELGFCLTHVLSLCLSHHFFVILYITCQILFFLCRTECKITYSHDH